MVISLAVAGTTYTYEYGGSTTFYIGSGDLSNYNPGTNKTYYLRVYQSSADCRYNLTATYLGQVSPTPTPTQSPSPSISTGYHYPLTPWDGNEICTSVGFKLFNFYNYTAIQDLPFWIYLYAVRRTLNRTTRSNRHVDALYELFAERGYGSRHLRVRH
jgi:hypothetical protein